ncbi:E3 ubiquitin-protein ligase RMA3-like [Malania oleifera]|uniref:E3 ubiquitin-protein ligase RMA3-like n=1 Tax=Malania oleifera TaxID=397392 RepID=UPI0025AE8711|nr:E3 ubiquitin-protein ligase RMA3-like [Malania oleifera]
MARFDLGDAASLKQKWKNIVSAGSTTAAENPNGCFDCNICLDSAHDPVVTLCGHLFCWPCIYNWIHFQTSPALAADHKQKCPVCKADVSPATVVPLYGSGSPSFPSEPKRPNLSGVAVPRRPAACGLHNLITAAASSPPNPHRSPRVLHDPHPHHGGYAAASADLRDVTSPIVFGPMVGILGKMVYSSMFGSSDTSLFSYPHNHQNSYAHLMGGRRRSGHRILRTQEMQADMSLNRISFFLFCCFLLCLLLF